MTIQNKQLAEFFQDWLNELQHVRRYSINTIIAYQNDVSNFILFIQKHLGKEVVISQLNQLKNTDFRSWLSYRIKNDFNPRSNVRALSSLKSFFKFLSHKRLINTNVINSIRRPQVDSLLPKPVQQNNLLSFLNASYYFTKDADWVTKRDKALYNLLYCSGLRINEALKLKVSDISREMHISGKGKKDRIIILLPDTISKIQDYINSCPYDLLMDYLFIGVKGKTLHASYVDNRLQKLRIIYNLPNNMSAHSFRHSFASHLIQNGADLRAVQDLLGHESLSSTEIYTDMDDYNLLNIYQKTHPLEK